MEEKLLEYQKLCNKVDEMYLKLKRLKEELDYLERQETRLALDLGKDITLGRRNRRLPATVAAEMYPSGHKDIFSAIEAYSRAGFSKYTIYGNSDTVERIKTTLSGLGYTINVDEFEEGLYFIQVSWTAQVNDKLVKEVKGY